MKMHRTRIFEQNSVLHQARMGGKEIGDGRKGEEMKRKEKKPKEGEQTE